VEYSLRFWARLIRAGLEDVPHEVPEAALAIGLSQESGFSVSYSLHVLYVCLALAQFEEFFTKTFDDIVPLIVRSFGDGKNPWGDPELCWRDRAEAAKQFTLLYFRKFGGTIPALLAWRGEVLRDQVAAICLLAATSNELIQGRWELFHEFLGEMIREWPTADASFKKALLQLFPSCGTFELLEPVLLELNGELALDALVALARFIPRIPDGGDRDKVACRLTTDFPDFFAIFMCDEAISRLDEVATAMKTMVEFLRSSLEHFEDPVSVSFDVFTRYVGRGDSRCVCARAALRTALLALPGDYSREWRDLCGLLEAATTRPCGHAIIEIMTVIVHVLPEWDPTMWEIAPLLFGLLDGNVVDSKDISPLLVTMIWKGRENLEGSDQVIAERIQAHMKEMGNDYVSWSSDLAVLTALCRADPGRAEAVVQLYLPQVRDYLYRGASESYFSSFLAFAFAEFPEQLAGEEWLLDVLVSAPRDPYFYPAALAVFRFVSSEWQSRLIEAEKEILNEEEESDELEPVWFDAAAARYEFYMLASS
jgi:hypothetical protein